MRGRLLYLCVGDGSDSGAVGGAAPPPPPPPTLLFFLFLFFPIYVSGTTRAERSDPP